MASKTIMYENLFVWLGNGGTERKMEKKTYTDSLWFVNLHHSSVEEAPLTPGAHI